MINFVKLNELKKGENESNKKEIIHDVILDNAIDALISSDLYDYYMNRYYNGEDFEDMYDEIIEKILVPEFAKRNVKAQLIN